MFSAPSVLDRSTAAELELWMVSMRRWYQKLIVRARL
jgi:hypothetical protein